MEKLIKTYKDLEVFKRSYAASLELHRLSLTYSKIEQFGGIADQIRRSSKSIPANIAEGFGKQRSRDKEFRRFLTIALGSSNETGLWLDYSFDLGYIDQEIYKRLSLEYSEISKMLNSLSQKWL